MKIMRYIKLFFIVSACFAFVNCEDLLDEESKYVLTDDVLWNSPSDFAMGTNKLYEFLPKIMNRTESNSKDPLDLKAINYVDGIMHRDLDAEIVSTFNSSTVISASTIGNEDPYNKNLYQTYYSQVRKCNFVLERGQAYSNQNEIKQYIGECYFFRAFSSYLYFRDFGPGIIVKTVLDVDAAQLSGTQAERLDFFNWMIEDLTAAEGYLTASKELAKADIGRITLEAVQALKARLYLFEGTWQKYHYTNTAKATDGKSFFQLAAENASKVIDSGSFELFRNTQMGDDSYRWMFILESSEQCNPYRVQKISNKEYILRNRYDENIKRSDNNISHTAQAYYASRKMVETYLDINGLPIEKSGVYEAYTDWDSFLRNRDPRLRNSIGYIGQQVWTYGTNGRVNWTDDETDRRTQVFIEAGKKSFRNLKWVTERNMSATEDGYDVPVIRLAEMYLTYAEGMFEANGSITNEQLEYSLNKVRERVGMPGLTNEFVAANGLDMLTEIRRERTVEFYLEGLRLDDLRRWKTAEAEMSGNIEGLPYAYKGSATIFTTSSIEFQLKNAQGNVILNSSGRPLLRYTYRKTSGTEQAYPDGSSYFLFQASDERTFYGHNYYRPVPREELVLNSNLKPSPGWESE